MHQYIVDRVTRLSGTDTITAVLDVGFSIKTKVTFKLSRVEAPEMDFFAETDPEFDLRSQIVQWFKTAPKPLYVHMHKNGKEYVGEILDKNGQVLADDLKSDQTTVTVVMDYVAPKATTSPSSV